MTSIEEHITRIQELKAQRKAIILAHNYQPPEIQDLADMTGDSLELSRKAAETEAEVILFCGVHFMAEIAAIVNPTKTVILPNPSAGCAMAEMITAEDVKRLREEYPGVPIVTYVNSTAAVKAESTICCTSANVNEVVNSFEDHPRLYLTPDRNLAHYAARHTNKEILFWNGFCPVHEQLDAQTVHRVKASHPRALFLAHPECRPEVIELADVVASTSGMLHYVHQSPHLEFIIGTEVGILHPMQKANPHKIFHPASASMVCRDMKKTSLEDIHRALETLEPKIVVSENVRRGALQAVQRMLAIRGGSPDPHSEGKE